MSPANRDSGACAGATGQCFPDATLEYAQPDARAVDEIAGGIQVTLEFTFEVEGASKPSCVAEIIFRQYV